MNQNKSVNKFAITSVAALMISVLSTPAGAEQFTSATL